MFSSIMLFIGTLLLFLLIKVFLKEINLYRNGIVKTAKIVELDSYSYITYGPERSKIYHVGINPILELEVDNKKLRVDYGSYDDMCDLSEGDEVEVIYPRGNIGEITRYSKYRLFKQTIGIGIITLLSILFGITMALL